MGGYEDKQLGPGHYQIHTTVNGYTDPKVIDEFFHRRAKELCGTSTYTTENVRYGTRDHALWGSQYRFPAMTGEVRCGQH